METGIEFQCSIKDYKRFSWLHFKEGKNNSRMLLFIIFLTVIISPSVAGDPFNWMKFIIGFVAIGILPVVIFFVIPYLISIQRTLKIIKADSKYTEKKRLSIVADGIFSTARDNLLKWEGILTIKSNAEFVWIILADKSLLIIPISAFPSNYEKINFMGVIQKEIKKREQAN